MRSERVEVCVLPLFALQGFLLLFANIARKREMYLHKLENYNFY